MEAEKIMDNQEIDKLIEHFSKFITLQRLNLFDQVLQNRTRYLTVVLEDIFQPHNASAVLRTCDCFGVQDVHVIENHNKYEVNPDIAMGSFKWLNLIRYNNHENNTLGAFNSLKTCGYTIIATSPRKGEYELDNLPLEVKPAFVFGTELTGLSETTMNKADAFVKIPMYGFTESFNVSVSAAIILHHFTRKLRKSNLKWQLSKEEKATIKLEWLRNTIKRSDLIEKEFRKFL